MNEEADFLVRWRWSLRAEVVLAVVLDKEDVSDAARLFERI